MKYIESQLQPNEKVLDRTTLHWIVYWPAPLLLLAPLCLLLYFDRTSTQHWYYVAAPSLVVAILGVFVFLSTVIARATTEIAITNRRIIYKTGLLSRRTIEMNVDKVESVDVDQSVLGQLLDYGTIVVRGVGTGIEPLQQIAAALKFRDAVLSLTAPQSSSAVPPSPTVPPSGFTGRNPATQVGTVFGHRRPMAE